MFKTALNFFTKMSKSLMYRAIIISEIQFRKTELSSESLINLKIFRVI